MKGIKVDPIKKTIVINKGFYEKAQNPSTAEFDLLAKVQNAYPTFYIEKKRAQRKSAYQTLNKECMLDFVIKSFGKNSIEHKALKDSLVEKPFCTVKADFYKNYETEIKAYLDSKKKDSDDDDSKVLDIA